MGKRDFRAGILGAAAVALLILAAVLWSDMDSKSAGGNGLFCWDKEVFNDRAQRDTLWRAMEQYDLHELYQYIPADLPPKSLSSFLRRRRNTGLEYTCSPATLPGQETGPERRLSTQ